MTQEKARISDASVQKATGKTWAQWFEVLDQEGAESMTHKEIAAWLYHKGHITNGWWCQEVTVEYERARGRRVVGETAGVGFEIGVQKTLPISLERAWELIATPPGRDIWLGKVPELDLAKGQAYETAEGTRGEVRSASPGKLLRLTWQPRHWQHPSTLQIYILPSGDKAAVRFHQEKLSSPEQREQMRRHWREVLDRLQDLAE